MWRACGVCLARNTATSHILTWVQRRLPGVAAADVRERSPQCAKKKGIETVLLLSA